MKQNTSSQLEIKEENSKILCTLLIPDECWSLLGKYKADLGKNTTAKFLEYLLEAFQEGQNTDLARRDKLTTYYQAEGLYLKKHNFLVDPVIWHRFKSLARFYGLSMCRLFTALLSALKSLGTPKNKKLPFLIRSFEEFKISYRRAFRSYKVQILFDTS